MTTQTLSVKCTRCMGTGIDDNLVPPGPCVVCGGDGYITSASLDVTEMMNELDWLKKKIKKILQKLEISDGE